MALSDKELTILLKVSSDVADLQKVVAGLRGVKGGIDETKDASFGLKEAFEFAGANAAIERILGFLEQIPERIYESIAAGVEFQAKMQDVATGIAAVLKQTQPEKFGNFAAAKAAANDYIAVIQQAADKIGVTYEQMFESVQGSISLLSSHGVTDINEIIKTTVLLQQAINATGVASNVAARDLVSLLSGNAQTEGGRALAAQLHMTTEQLGQLIQQAEATGDLPQFVQRSFGGFSDAIADASQNFNADLNRMRNAITALENEAAKPIMEPLKSGVDGAIDPERMQQFLTLARFIGEIAKSSLEAAGELVKLGSAIESVGQHYQGLANVLRLISHITPTGLLFHDVVAKSFDGAQKAVEAEAQATKKATDNIKNSWQETQEAGEKSTQQTGKQTEALAKADAAARLLFATASGDGPAIAAERAYAGYVKYIDEVKKSGVITSEQLDTGLKIYKTIYDQTIAQQQHRQASIETRDAHQEISNLLRQEDALLRGIRGNQQLVSEDPRLDAGTKERLLVASYKAEKRVIDDEIASYEVYVKAHLAAAASDEVEKGKIDELIAKIKDLKLQRGLLDIKTATSGSFAKDFTTTLENYVNAFGTAGQQAGQAFTQSIDISLQGTNQLIAGLITHTTTWQQALVGVEEQIAQVFLTWIEHMAEQEIASLLHITTVTTAQETSGAAIATAHGPAAAATAVSSYGAAAVIGEVLTLAAIAAIIAALSDGLAEGGRVPGAPSRRDNLLVSMATGETVINAGASQHLDRTLGANWYHDLNNRRIPSAFGGFASGGRIGNSLSPASSSTASRSGGADAGVQIYNFTDIRKLRNALLKAPEGRKVIVDTIDGSRRELGL